MSIPLNVSRFISNPWFVYSSMALFILVFTFPGLYPIITPGLDASYVLAINHLAANEFSAFKDIIYPFGPLGFLKYPLPVGNNLEIGIIWLIIVRMTFIGMILYIGHLVGKNRWYIFLLALVFTNLLHFDQNIYGIILFSLILHKLTNKHAFLVTAILLTITGLYIKINLGFIGSLFCASYLIYDLYLHRNFKKLLAILGLFSACLYIDIYSPAGKPT